MAISFTNISAKNREFNSHLFKATKNLFEKIRACVEENEDVIRIDVDETTTVHATLSGDTSKVMKAGSSTSTTKPPYVMFINTQEVYFAGAWIYMGFVGGKILLARNTDELNASNADVIISAEKGWEREPKGTLDPQLWDGVKALIKLYAEESAE